MPSSDFWIRITSLYVSQTWPVILCMYKNVLSIRMTSLYGSQPSSVVLRIQNSDLKTKIACVYEYQTSLVIFCMQNSLPSIGITSLSGFQPSSVVLASIPSSFGPEKRMSMSPRPHLSFCACKIAWLASELLVTMGPSPYLWFWHAKQPVLYPNNECLWVPDLACHFVHAKQCD